MDATGPAPLAILDRRVSRRDLLRTMGLGALSGVIVACNSAATTFPPTEAPSAAPTPAPTAAPTPPPTGAPTPAPSPAPTSAPTAAPSSAPTAPPTSAPTAPPTPVPTAKARGGTIRVGALEHGLEQGWLTWKASGLEFVWNWCAQRLLSVAPDGTIVYDMAKSHSVSADGREYTFSLVPGATWHDGRPVTAADVAFTYNSALKATAGSTIQSLVAPIQGSQAVINDNSRDASGIAVIDDLTIRFVLDQPAAQILPTAFGAIFITPKHPFDGVARKDYEKQTIATDVFIGSGPMRMTRVTNRALVDLDARDDYVNGSGWQGRPGADRVSIRIHGDDTTLLAAARAGEVDFAYVRNPSGGRLKQLRAIPGMSAQQSLVGFNVFYSFFLGDGTDEPPNPVVKRKEFRQATVWALDLPLLVKDVLGGALKVPDIFNQWIAPWANSDRLVRYTPQDLAKAKDLLARSGYKGETIICGTYGREPDFPVILAMWKDVGINTKRFDIPDGSFFEDFYTHPKYDIAFAYGFGTLDGSPWGSDSFLGSKSFPQAGGYNAFRFSSEEWDREYAAALAAPDEATQAVHFGRCSEIFNDELPYVPMYQRVDYALVGATLRGPEQVTILHPAVGGVRYWEWYVRS